MAERSIAVLLVLVFSLAPLSGCLDSEPEEQDPAPEHWLPSVENRSEKIYRSDDVFSRVSWNGSFDIGEALSIYVPVPEIGLTDGGAGATGDAEVHLGLWLPAIEGCDWGSEQRPDEG